MQIIELERNEGDFFCPSTGVKLFGEDGAPLSPAVRACWFSEEPSEPIHLDVDLLTQWEAHLEAQQAADDCPDVVTFLQGLQHPNWVAFEVNTFGMACGLVWNTTWTVLDLGEVSEQEGD
jgi:hypothetical protein